MEKFDVKAEQLGDRYMIRAVGELDIASADQLRHAFAMARSQTATIIEVDLRGLGFIDSTGLHLLFDMRAGAAPARIEFTTSHAVDRLLEITGMTAALTSQQS